MLQVTLKTSKKIAGYHMGVTAERIVVWSQNRFEKAIADGKFKEEIVLVVTKRKR